MRGQRLLSARLRHLQMNRAATIALLVVCGACGGADVELLDPSDGGSLDGASSLDSSVDATTTTDGGSQDASTTLDVTQPKDAAPPPYQNPGIACGNVECDPDADLCCGTPTSYYPQETYSFACESLTDFVQCAAGLPIDCDDDQDCPNGQSCCATIGYQDYSKVACQAGPCANTIYAQEAHFCDPKNSNCQSSTCKPAPYLTGYFTCQ